MKASDNLIRAMGVTLEITQTNLSDPAIKAMLFELEMFPEQQVLAALRRCYREVKTGRLCLADILSRIEDGRPAPEEAWAMIPRDEAASAFWTEEMREAYGVAAALITQGDNVAARMAFLEKYRSVVQQARDARYPVRWTFSPGTDKTGRELVLLDGAAKGRISATAAAELLPYHRGDESDEGVRARLLSIASGSFKRLGGPAT